MLRSKIIDSKPRSPSSYTFSRDNCDDEVIGIITLKAHGNSFQFISRKTLLEHQAATSKRKNPKKGRRHQLTSILHLSITTRRKKKKKARVFHLVVIHARLRKDLF
ncbi:hypothetical protein AVEN_257130-1 [Araneus ventricosus]|uniref:Uncharacterized protein n=1 Tax=Araneus ventricosus TaxID=182803 RepID=A0A4Y2FRN4_ARAVE|nr:hypothetical protein AVEN_257130-1 [Araneus ventricosus]